MYRRRGPNESKEMGDDIQLVDITNSERSAPSRVGEESHVIPKKLVLLRRRMITKVASPKGKLLYWWTTVVFLGISSFLFVLIPLLVEQGLNKQDCTDYEGDNDNLPYFYRKKTGDFEICREKKLVLKGKLGVDRTYFSEVKVNVFTHSMDSTLNITAVQSKNKNCLLVQWVGFSSKDSPIQDCYEIDNAYWYGAYEHPIQRWPINISDHDSLISSPFLPHDYLSDQFSSRNSFGPILHPLWLNTNGVGIVVDEGVQLHVSMNSTQLCLLAQPFELDCASNALDHTYLNYTVCVFDTVAQAAQYFLNDSGIILHPISTPSHAIFDKPIWSTWAEFKTNISTEGIANFCAGIIDHGFNISQLEIDDGYSLFYGELEFNANVSIEELLTTSCQGIDITVWVHPFVNYDASNFKQGLLNDMYLPGTSQIQGSSVSLVKWWQGFGAVINFANRVATEAYSQSLSNFKNRLNISSLKFDAGEYTYLPKCVFIEGLNHPGEFTKAYVQFVGNLPYSDRAEVRVGYFSQGEPILFRLLDRTSIWDINNGLHSVVNAILSIGLGGYNFVIPDMIGGNGVIASNLASTTKPSKELYVRWAQLNTFLPVMQFSITPWSYDDSVVKHVRELTQLHSFLEFGRLADQSLVTGFPIIRPLWWRAIESNDEETWTISDQFYIGDDYMVAPMLTVNETKRIVYFPLGSNYSLVNTIVSAKSVCLNNICPGGSFYTFNVSLYEVLFFHIM